MLLVRTPRACPPNRSRSSTAAASARVARHGKQRQLVVGGHRPGFLSDRAAIIRADATARDDHRAAAFERRGPGTDAERRAARWLAGELMADRHRVRIETFWCRPNWAMAHAWHVALALVGSLVSVESPDRRARSCSRSRSHRSVSDEVAGISLGRRLTPEHASQNVVARTSTATAQTAGPTPQPAGATTEATGAKTPLIITANYDAGRTALVYRDPLRRSAAEPANLAGRGAPWAGSPGSSIAIAWLLAVAIVRTSVHQSSTALGLIQLLPTVALVLSARAPARGRQRGPTVRPPTTTPAASPRRSRSPTHSHGPARQPNRRARAARRRRRRRDRHPRYLRARRRELRDANAIVLGIAPSGAGHPAWWVSDGRLVPFDTHRPLRALPASRPKPRHTVDAAPRPPYRHARAACRRSQSAASTAAASPPDPIGEPTITEAIDEHRDSGAIESRTGAHRRHRCVARPGGGAG